MRFAVPMKILQITRVDMHRSTVDWYGWRRQELQSVLERPLEEQPILTGPIQ